MRSIDEIRKDIDDTDRELVRLFCRRMELSDEMGRLKSARGLPVRDTARENELKAKVGGLSDPRFTEQILGLYDRILTLSREYQEKEHI